jgi:hypothetical protein
VEIFDKPVKINAAPKIPTAASAAQHKAGGGNVEITNKRVVYNAGPKIPTAKSASAHKAGGGNVEIFDKPVKINAAPKIPTAASAAQHKAGGGNVEIFDKVRQQTGPEEQNERIGRLTRRPQRDSGSEAALLCGETAPATSV